MSCCSARITNIDPGVETAELVQLFESKGLSISPGQSRISLATGLEGTKIATVTFKDGAALGRALRLDPQERLLQGSHISLDATFDGFTPLSDGNDLDIVALHGLNGHAFDTWLYREREDHFMWLRDSLAEHFPGARILTYGYNANVVSDVSTGRLRTFAETFLERLRLERESDEHRHKPLILVAHSMGGLVIKQAVVIGDTRADKRYKDMLESLSAIMFFGTPHQGGNGVAAGQLFANLLKAVNVEVRGDLLKQLETSSLSLFDLSGDFRQAVQRMGIVIYTMYETKKTKIGHWPAVRKLLVVTEQSAILGTTGERKTSVNATHANICKFTGPGDPAYNTVRQVLRELKAEITPIVMVQDAATQPNPPPDLKYSNLLNEDTLEGDTKNYPVLVWGTYTYWALSHTDNRYGMTILAYDKQGRVANRWEKTGARYIVSIRVNKDRVEFAGQGGRAISLSLRELKIS